MKKIILIDNRSDGYEKSFALKYPFLVCYQNYPDIDKEKSSDIAAIFVHKKNELERDWATDNNINPLIVFSDGIAQGNINKNIYNITRTALVAHLGEFLDFYSKQEIPDGNIFFGITRAKSMPNSDALDPEVAPEPEVVTRDPFDTYLKFTDQAVPARSDYFTITFTADRSIDYLETIRRLSELPNIRGIYLQEEYSQPFDGLYLAWYVRLSAFLGEFSRAPICIEIRSTIEKITRADLRFGQILFNSGTLLVEKQQVAVNSLPEPLSLQAYKRFLASAHAAPPETATPHDMSNLWGALRLMQGYRGLSTVNPSMLGYWDMARDMMAHDYFWLQLSRAKVTSALLAPTRTQPSPDFSDERHRWECFLDGLPTPWNILFVDDELDKGWKLVVSELFARNAQPRAGVTLTTYPDAQGFNLDTAIALSLSQQWGMVLCDLRLTSADKATGTSLDQQTISALAGCQIIRQLKEMHPNIPVIAFTASDKVWTYQYVLDIGADGYWLKENPLYGIDETASTANAASLILMIRTIAEHKKEISYLWEAIVRLRQNLLRPDYINQFVRLDLTAAQALQYLQSVEERLKNAYGYLDYSPTQYRRAFVYKPNNLAFLTIWSCINELLKLYYYEPSPGAYSLLRRSGSATNQVVYAKMKQGTAGKAKVDYEAWFRPIKNGNIASGQGDLNLDRFYPWRPGFQIGPEHIYILLRENNKTFLEQQFESCKQIRNKLDIEHGDYVSQLNAQGSDVSSILNVIQYLLMV